MRLSCPTLIVLLAVLGCGSDEPKSAATAEGGASAAGGGGAGGISSQGGRAGDPSRSTIPPSDSCPEPEPFAGLLFNEGGTLVDAPLTASVKLLSLDPCSAVTCPNDSPVEAQAQRILLADPDAVDLDGGADSARWTLVVLLAGLPSDLLEVDAQYDLKVDAQRPALFDGGISQTLVLSHGSELVLALSTQRQRFVRPPSLDAFGVSLATGAATCEAPNQGLFGVRQRSLLVTRADESVEVARGGQASLGDLSIHLVAFDSAMDDKFSDKPEKLQLGIFRVPQP